MNQVIFLLNHFRGCSLGSLQLTGIFLSTQTELLRNIFSRGLLRLQFINGLDVLSRSVGVRGLESAFLHPGRNSWKRRLTAALDLEPVNGILSLPIPGPPDLRLLKEVWQQLQQAPTSPLHWPLCRGKSLSPLGDPKTSSSFFSPGMS